MWDFHDNVAVIMKRHMLHSASLLPGIVTGGGKVHITIVTRCLGTVTSEKINTNNALAVIVELDL